MLQQQRGQLDQGQIRTRRLAGSPAPAAGIGTPSSAIRALSWCAALPGLSTGSGAASIRARGSSAGARIRPMPGRTASRIREPLFRSPDRLARVDGLPRLALPETLGPVDQREVPVIADRGTRIGNVIQLQRDGGIHGRGFAVRRSEGTPPGGGLPGSRQMLAGDRHQGRPPRERSRAHGSSLRVAFGRLLAIAPFERNFSDDGESRRIAGGLCRMRLRSGAHSGTSGKRHEGDGRYPGQSANEELHNGDYRALQLALHCEPVIPST